MDKRIKLAALSLIINAPAWSANAAWFPPEAKASIEASVNPVYTRTYTSSADVIVPVVEDKNSLVFSNFFAKTGSDEKWSLSGGGGYRQIIHDRFILGAYTYIDHIETAKQNSFWEISPGVDYMTLDWDLHCNTYIPLGQAQKTVKVSAEKNIKINIAGQVFQPLYRDVEVEGPGIEAAAGYVFRNFHHIHLTVGSYYFSEPHRSSIQGVTGIFEAPLGHGFSFLAKDTYNNLKQNEVLIGLKLVLDEKPQKDDLIAYVKNPIVRNLASVGSGGIGEVTDARYATGGLQAKK